MDNESLHVREVKEDPHQGTSSFPELITAVVFIRKDKKIWGTFVDSDLKRVLDFGNYLLTSVLHPEDFEIEFYGLRTHRTMKVIDFMEEYGNGQIQSNI